MKKAAFVLALVMLLGCVSGCGAVEGEASVQSVSMICGLGSVGLADRFAGIVSPLGETTIKKNDAMTIDTIKVKVGDSVKVVKLHGEGAVKRRIMDMGLTKGVEVYVRKVAPLGDPVEVTVRGYELSLRKADAEMIEVE